MICISLAGITFEECVKAIAKSQFSEIRIDQLDLSDTQLKTLFAMRKNIIATCRPGTLDEDRRKALLKLAINSGAGYVDIEFEAQAHYRRELIDEARRRNVMVIISYHNYDTTPDREELEMIIDQSMKMGADRVKLATFANSQSDNARILSLYETHPNLIAFCMGKMGMITRVAAPFLGSEFTYASVSGKLATAPGQLAYDDFIDIFDLIKE